MGVTMLTHRSLVRSGAGRVLLHDVRTQEETDLGTDALLLVTAKLPASDLFNQLNTDSSVRVARIGDCEAPAAIFAAVYSGHRFAQQFDERSLTVRRERILLTP